ncbi:peptide chain release factor 3 [Rhodococcus sp. BP-349]|uniref:peptide chain release factor 3 n=1 Tax=unclassified Rhodococcus (in: high G+C Gram-positive bacteria) TaxID=192944 RepID=UPI001C9A7352|nr:MULTISPECIES: peptide chain release factor 3 [unclassified Rhodococcus (in: high G+C Gram-positive bacteria)]MBY6538396.1 peptide chain release factor 3 [Rhodococcus sp. BP-363]MBY6542733.1 peptide chain release factor 3 [Rhodococcus sp. BP-369]MBY6561963.1 peptide chain release factor 3 [Rhodococcus sp. BP-370]MBY6576255.1 peptide chain release factor 3 [Rhodococcus sp. BP-364]MBY6585556.1 peptide chain release factor 3 [Rhodococcus sp. BP-358]
MSTPSVDTDTTTAAPATGTTPPKNLRREVERRRTFAVISHPDAGKSTLTEALALHARKISEAGAIHGKSGRRSTVSDWMEMEKARGISVSSTALQFDYADHTINLVDTPGHADFSEDTYRVLTAVDAAVMLIDAAKGLEPQTLKLFQVCRHRGIPVITVVNKWDRPGRSPLELLDEIEERIGLTPTPLYWPVGIAGDFRGLLDVSEHQYIHFTRTAGGATIAPEEFLDSESAQAREGDDWTTAVEESELLVESGQHHDEDEFLAGRTSPVIFASAMLNFGVHQILDTLVSFAPAPGPRPDVAGGEREVTDPFSAVVFKVQAGMDTAHRDRLAFMRVVSGVFERGMVVTHAQTGKPFTTKYALTVFGRERTTVENAYPGDVVGLVNATALAPGHTLYADRKVEFPPIPSFAPEHFAVLRAESASKYKQFRRAVDQMDQEGVVQILRNDIRGDASPVLAAVGPMQFEVVSARMKSEFGVEARMEPLGYSIARRTDAASAGELGRQRGVEVFTRTDGVMLALVSDKWRLQYIQKELPDLLLEPLVAAAD